MAAGLLFVLQMHLLSALLAGLLVHELAMMLAPRVGLLRIVSGRQAKAGAIALLGTALILAIAAAVWGMMFFVHSESGSLSALLAKMAEILDSLRSRLPGWLASSLPEGDGDALQDIIVEWLREHAASLQSWGTRAGVLLAHVLVGMILGALIAVNEVASDAAHGPLAVALSERVRRLAEAFRRMVFAQIRISALNTVLTGLFLEVVLPLAGVDLPLTKTMIVVSFFAGLIPVAGNLISNTVIVVVALAHGFGAAASSLAFLVIIHKLEYFVNARIVGAQINARAWELLAAMLVMETAFGITGVVAAPIIYAYLKGELKDRGLI